MLLRTLEDEIKDVPRRWHNAYNYGEWLNDQDKQDKAEKLFALSSEELTKENIDKIIGNDSWTKLHCDECNEYVKKYIILSVDGGDCIYRICPECIKEAYEAFYPYN